MTRRRRRTRRKSALIKSNNPHLAGDSQVLTITIVFKLHIYIYGHMVVFKKKKKHMFCFQVIPNCQRPGDFDISPRCRAIHGLPRSRLRPW